MIQLQVWDPPTLARATMRCLLPKLNSYLVRPLSNRVGTVAIHGPAGVMRFVGKGCLSLGFFRYAFYQVRWAYFPGNQALPRAVATNGGVNEGTVPQDLLAVLNRCSQMAKTEDEERGGACYLRGDEVAVSARF